mmetsp:Transcript_1205/g.2443  ORF Transcript_1205/g.2443 Transcript_1205/m.2443 type:complete len:250 (+) Transcript_1205:217-966(+)
MEGTLCLSDGWFTLGVAAVGVGAAWRGVAAWALGPLVVGPTTALLVVDLDWRNRESVRFTFDARAVAFVDGGPGVDRHQQLRAADAAVLLPVAPVRGLQDHQHLLVRGRLPSVELIGQEGRQVVHGQVPVIVLVVLEHVPLEHLLVLHQPFPALDGLLQLLLVLYHLILPAGGVVHDPLHFVVARHPLLHIGQQIVKLIPVQLAFLVLTVLIELPLGLAALRCHPVLPHGHDCPDCHGSLSKSVAGLGG